jgi:RNA polymerase sigma factor (sigma-70 family)
MECFSRTRNLDVFAVLHEVATPHLTLVVYHYLGGNRVDAQDILQETFLAIFRYPQRFRNDRPSAFRQWSSTIVRHSIYRQRKAREGGVDVAGLEEILADEQHPGPDVEAQEAEALGLAIEGYLLCLLAYRQTFARLNLREQEALFSVEIGGHTYQQTADRMGCKVQNVKMLICRARKKLMSQMRGLVGRR